MSQRIGDLSHTMSQVQDLMRKRSCLNYTHAVLRASLAMLLPKNSGQIAHGWRVERVTERYPVHSSRTQASHCTSPQMRQLQAVQLCKA
jgi:hypothetical protein